MLKIILILFSLAGGATGYKGMQEGDQTLMIAGLAVAAIAIIWLILAAMKMIGCLVTTLVICAVLGAIAYFGGFLDGVLGEKAALPAGLTQMLGSSGQSASPTKTGEPKKIFGKPVVSTGDTVLVMNRPIHFYGVEAPLMSQTCTDAKGSAYYCGQTAKEKLAGFIAGNMVECFEIGTQSKITHAVCQIGAHDLGALMVGLGYAFPNPEHGQVYIPYETHARLNKQGLWAGKFMAPWQWREQAAKNPAQNVSMPTIRKKRDTNSGSGKLWNNFWK